MTKLLEVEGLKTRFDTRDGTVRAVDDVSFDLDEGETLAIVGESGAGKTVTALSVMRLVPEPGRIVAGDVRFEGESVLEMGEPDVRALRGDRIAMVFQDPMTSLDPVRRVGDQIGEPLRIHRGLTRKEAFAEAVELLGLAGVPRPSVRAREYPHQFSGGMRQRALIAMALSCEPDVLIADEPTTALDVTIQAQILELLKDLQERAGTAVIVITHDLGVVADVADRVLVLYAGRPAEYGTAHQVFREPRHPYTWGLLDSLPRHDLGDRGALTPIEGQPPSPFRIPSGCPFHPRCRYAQDVCRRETPPPVSSEEAPSASCHFSKDDAFVAAGQQAVRP